MVKPEDFDALARVALAQAPTLLSEWVGGRQVGREWTAKSTSQGGIGNSWSFNLDSGRWGHFAGDELGGDIISFYAAVFHVDQGPAADAIAELIGWRPGHSAPPILPRTVEPGPEHNERIPADAAALLDHPQLGNPTAIYYYGDRFVVTRHERGESKTFSQWSWRGGKWVNQGIAGPRPLYQLEQVFKRPTAPVLVVEGEKCVDQAALVLRDHVIVTWAGGANAVRKTDWMPLHGRKVTIWPDADQPGRKAAAQIAGLLAGHATTLQVINPNGADPGWDIADAIAGGWGAEQIREWTEKHLEQPISVPGLSIDSGVNQSSGTRHSSIDSPSRQSARTSLATDLEASPLVTLADMGLECDRNGIPFPTLANASKILQSYQGFKDRIWFDEFRGAIHHTLRSSTPIRWTDAETRSLTVNIQQQLKLPKFTSRLVEEGLHHAAECHRRNSLTEWLDSLTWQGISRLDTWLTDCAGVELNDYTMAVARNWPIAMVARAYHPGCKMDNMPVLEGVSGLRKTQFLGILGGEWYKALSMQFGEKDFLQALRGAWLIEIPDMAGFNRAEHTKILAVITTAIDTYRVPYGREPEDVPRTCMFAATSETDDYLTDARGKRRYWPVRCTDINLDALRTQRDQLFAEAVQRYRQGEHWYEMPHDAAQEQAARVEGDEWTEAVLVNADRWWTEYQRDPIGSAVTAKRLITSALEIPIGQITTGQCRRVTSILKDAGWVRKRDANGFIWLKRLPV